MTVKYHVSGGWQWRLPSLAILLFIYYLTLIDNQLNWLISTNHKLLVNANQQPHNHLVLLDDDEPMAHSLYQQRSGNSIRSLSSLSSSSSSSQSPGSWLTSNGAANTNKINNNDKNNNDIRNHDLLPLSYFFIPQAPFSDIIKPLSLDQQQHKGQPESNSNSYNKYKYSPNNQYSSAGKGKNLQSDLEKEEDLEYENSMRDQQEQVLYYGPQLVYEGEVFDIGCFLPKDDHPEWTRSGYKIMGTGHRAIKRDFLNIKINYTLRVFEASLNDTGSYRCDRYSRKAHKLSVVSQKISNAQLYNMQQRLLLEAAAPNNANSNNIHQVASSSSWQPSTLDSSSVPGIMIVENESLTLDCAISDEYIMKQLETQPQFQLSWFKNGKQISTTKQPRPSSSTGLSQRASTNTQQQPSMPDYDIKPSSTSQGNTSSSARRKAASASTRAPSTPQLVHKTNQKRIKFRQPNGRQLYIQSAQYGDAGDWLCSWSEFQSKLQTSSRQSETDGPDFVTATESNGASINPLSAGSTIQLLAPVKLRRYRANYRLKRGNDLRLKCAIERGFPPPQITWFIGNEVVDADYIKNNDDKIKILSNNDLLQQQQSPTNTNAHPIITLTTDGGTYSSSDTSYIEEDQKYVIDISPKATVSAAARTPLIQSTLVVHDLDIDKHTARYACRAQNRISSDEVSTMIRIQDSAVTTIPNDGKVTLIPGQNLSLRCSKTGDEKANFKWYRKGLSSVEREELRPEDEPFEIHNERLRIKKPGLSSVADYYCCVLDEKLAPLKGEEGMFRVRTQPFIEDFDLATSHTGKSGIITDGERLELKCEVKNSSGQVKISWLKSTTGNIPDDLSRLQGMTDLEDGTQQNSHITIRDQENTKTLIIESVSIKDRGHYICLADNNVTDKGFRPIFIRVKDKLIALWPLLGIISELAILFSIIFIWENQRANC